jgi:hypothetical protein
MKLNHRLLVALCLSVACAAMSAPAVAQRGGFVASELALPLIIDNAVAKTAIPPKAAERCMVMAVPLRDGWQVPLINGRPALSITGAERWQFRATDTFPSGNVRWAVGRAVVSTGGPPNMSIGLALGPGVSAGADLATLLPGGNIAIDAGLLQATVRKTAFNVLDRVVVAGTELIAPGTSPGILASLPDGTPLVVSSNTQLTIVENGPAYAQVKAMGTLQTAAGAGVIDFTCRLTFTWNSPDVEVQFTVRNANIQRPKHTSLKSLELALTLAPGSAPLARVALPAGETQAALAPGQNLYAYQAYSSAFTEETTGSGTAWLSPITKTSSTTYAQEGYSVVKDGVVQYAGNKDQYPLNEWLDLAGSAGGCTVSILHMPHFWPASLQASGTGRIVAGLFPPHNEIGYTWTWRQHESRTAVFSFHKGPSAAPVEVSRRLESPAVGRFESSLIYQASDCFGYDMLSIQEQNFAYTLLGLQHQVSINNLYLTITRFLPMGATGGENNHDYIERLLAVEYLRLGTGGQWCTAMDLALWKCESQILRSDNFNHDADPGAINDSVPHTKNIAGDDEHRYMGGIALAWYMTGDERFRDALFDEAEILQTLDIWPHERSMYQSLVAITEVAAVTHKWAKLTKLVHQRLDYFNLPVIDVASGVEGYGWDGPPGLGPRGCYVFSQQNLSEKKPGEAYVTRGFITSSMGPRAMYRAARYLGLTDADAKVARLRLRDLARYTRDELFPTPVKPEDGHLVYSYGVVQEVVNSWESADFHPILLGMAEAWRDTGDVGFLLKGLEQIQAFASHDNMEWIDRRIECQHYLRAILDAAKAAGLY